MVLYTSTSNNRRERQRNLYDGELSILFALSTFQLRLIKLTNPSTAESNRKLRLYSFAIKISQHDHLKKHPTILPHPWDLFPTSSLPFPTEMWSEPWSVMQHGWSTYTVKKTTKNPHHKTSSQNKGGAAKMKAKLFYSPPPPFRFFVVMLIYAI